MTRNSLFLFLLLIAVGAGLCSAQTADKYFLIDDNFYMGIPPGLTMSDVVSFNLLKDDEGHQAMKLKLKEDVQVSDEAVKQCIPIDEVPGGEKLLELSYKKKGIEMVMRSFNTAKPEEWIGKSMPKFKVTDTTGRMWTEADILGKPFVLNFWHTGCGPCIKEMPDLNEWMKICPDVTYFSTTWNTPEQIKKIVENRPFLFTHIVDELFFFNQFKVQVTPTTLLIDKKGIIRYWEEGGSEAKRNYLLDKLKELAAE